jgi:hypothetical protein
MSKPEVDQINAHWNKFKASAENGNQQVLEAELFGKKQQRRSINENRNPGILFREDKNPKQILR